MQSAWVGVWGRSIEASLGHRLGIQERVLIPRAAPLRVVSIGTTMSVAVPIHCVDSMGRSDDPMDSLIR
jgi:hypothetical protein